MRELSGREFEELRDAFVAAFPTVDDLRQMLRFKRGLNLDEFTDGPLGNRVFTLIQRAEAEGWTLDLVYAAREKNPGNWRLAAIAARLPLVEGATTRAEEEPKPPNADAARWSEASNKRDFEATRKSLSDIKLRMNEARRMGQPDDLKSIFGKPGEKKN
jgi:Effector-associated domain 1